MVSDEQIRRLQLRDLFTDFRGRYHDHPGVQLARIDDEPPRVAVYLEVVEGCDDLRDEILTAFAGQPLQVEFGHPEMEMPGGAFDWAYDRSLWWRG